MVSEILSGDMLNEEAKFMIFKLQEWTEPNLRVLRGV